MELETELRSTSAGTYFSRHAAREPVELSFDNLTYSVSQGFQKGSKTILHNIGGRFESGQIIAIMGPSGAGKSSLLDLLSGYRISGVAGSVYVNDRFRDLDEFRRLSCYIQQDDRLQPLLTVDENMWAAADLKLPSSVPTKEKTAIIDEILETLKLSGSKKTRAGQLSGGQKKRLSIALELVNNPLVMFLDEPTTFYYLVDGTQNGKCYKWFTNGEVLKYNNNAAADVTSMSCLPIMKKCGGSLQVTSQWNQISVLLRRGFIKMKRDQTLTHMRFMVNVLTGMMLGALFFQTGNKGERVLDNFNLLFSILIHHTMTTKVLTILTFPMEMSILNKEYFNRWYSLKSYYIATNILDIPVLTVCAITFSAIIYAMSGQPLDWTRFSMFTGISLLVVYISQSLGFMVGSIFNVVNGTFVGPTMLVPMMMFSGFGVSLRDIPGYMKWGTNLSYLRYSLEGYVAAIYGLNRPILPCTSYYCHYKYPKKFMSEVAMNGDQFWLDVYALLFTLFLTRVAAYILLRWRIRAMR
ncbi:ATP-binding cassette sub-family G member 4 [Nilaparvata lugens]|uniref:ATP-binding cassette sub-family G member 4 n=1 Tax=Nilaparvata lugens TaxID=108931 RepID=UPI00193D8BF5|nr:ATP-binding cassette sub-family G member 4 [Nilaparvata lugens]